MAFLYPYLLAGINPAPWFDTGMTVSRTWAMLHAKIFSSQGRAAVLWLALVLGSVTSLEKEADESKDWDTAHSRGLFSLNLSSSSGYSGILFICNININKKYNGFFFPEPHFFALKMLPKFSPLSCSVSDTKAQRLPFRHASHFVWERFSFYTKQFPGMLLLSLFWCQTLPFW